MSPHHCYGIHTVSTLLKYHPERIRQLFLAKDSPFELHDAVSIQYVQPKTLEKMVGKVNHQGIVAECVRLPPQDDRKLKSWIQARLQPNNDASSRVKLLILDGIQDPHNLGACLRSADAFGIDAVIIPKKNAAKITATVSKVACGAAETMLIFQVVNLARSLSWLKTQGIWLYGADGQSKQLLTDLNFKTISFGLILGNEGHGLRRLTRERCDLLFTIPMCGFVESLNVSVATGICLYAQSLSETW